VDGAWRRAKAKHPGYVALHHSLPARPAPARQRAIAALLQRGEAGEVLAGLPALRPAVEAAAARYARLVDALEADAARLSAITDPRAFAAAAAGTRWAGALFNLRAGRCASARAALADMKTDTLARLLGMDPDAPASAWGSDAAGPGPIAGPGPGPAVQEPRPKRARDSETEPEIGSASLDSTGPEARAEAGAD
jgi:hypothetical protein